MKVREVITYKGYFDEFFKKQPQKVRVQLGNNIFRIFCFFDGNKLVVLLSGFQKKTQKTPPEEIKRAERLMTDYYEEKGKEIIK